MQRTGALPVLEPVVLFAPPVPLALVEPLVLLELVPELPELCPSGAAMPPPHAESTVVVAKERSTAAERMRLRRATPGPSGKSRIARVLGVSALRGGVPACARPDGLVVAVRPS